MEMNFCRRCGAPLKSSTAHVYQCSNGHVIFTNAVPAAGIWLLNDANEILAATRAHDPGKGMLDSPGGFTDGAETYEDSIRREVREELGLSTNDYTTPEIFMSGLDTYDYKGERFDVLTAIFVARIKGSPKILPQDDVERAEFLPA